MEIGATEIVMWLLDCRKGVKMETMEGGLKFNCRTEIKKGGSKGLMGLTIGWIKGRQ